MTDEDRYKQLLIDAICGVGFPSLVLAQECERVGMADLNVTKDGWLWDRKALWRVTTEQLQELYEGVCEAREELLKPTEPLDEDDPSFTIILQ